jgi:hypothetical protein
MKLARLLLVWLALVPTAFAIDRNAFTFTNYELNVRAEPEQQRLGVRGKVTLRNDSATPQKIAILQISSSLDWRSIQVNSKPVQFISQPYTSDIDHTGALSEAIVTLPQSVPPKGTVELEIGYEGTVPLDTTRLQRIGVPEGEAKHTDWDQISPSFTAVRGVGYVVWYPVAMDSASLSDGNSVFQTLGRWKTRELGANMNVSFCTLTLGSSPVVLMNDKLSGTPGRLGADRSGGRVTSCDQHTYSPLGITVPAFTLGEFQPLEKPLLDIYYLSDQKSAAENYGVLTDKLAPFFSLWFGQPRSRTKVVELPDAAAAPFESGTILLTPFTSDSKLAELTLAHQIAHSLFTSPRPWIEEGIAHFAQALWREHASGRQAALDYLGIHRTALAEAEKVTERNSASDHSLINTADDEFYRSKAMFVWWMLRDMIGDAALRRTLAAYRPDEDKSPSYLEKLTETESKRELNWFFGDWVYQDRGLPNFRVISAYPRALQTGGFMTTVTIENLGGAGAEVPITVNIEGGEVTKRLEVRAKATASVRIETPSAPQEIMVNDGSVPESDTTNNTFKITTK